MGVPVITMNHGGMAELIEDGVTGILVKESTPQEFAAGLQRALASDEYCNSLRENCKNAREQILSVEEYAKILMEEYKKLMKR